MAETKMPVRRCLNFDEQQHPVVVCQYCNVDGHVAKMCLMLAGSKPFSGQNLDFPTSSPNLDFPTSSPNLDSPTADEASMYTGEDECTPIREMLYIQFPALREIHASRKRETHKCRSLPGQLALINDEFTGATSLSNTSNCKTKVSPIGRTCNGARTGVGSNRNIPSMVCKPVLVPMVEMTTSGGSKTHVSFDSFTETMNQLGEPVVGSFLDNVDVSELETSQVQRKVM